MTKKRPSLKIILPLLILVVAGVCTKILLNQKQPPQKQEQVERGLLVNVLTVKKGNVTIPILATGTVTANNEMDVTAQISGRVTKVSQNFVAGGFVNKGDHLFSLEKADFEFALKKAEAEKEKIKLELITIESQATVARSQWEQINPDKKPQPLTVYEPQLANAKAQLAAAQASIRQAELNLKRTRVHAPFSGLIQQKNIALGKYVMPGTSLGYLLDSSVAEINIPLQPENLKWLEVPGTNVDTKGSTAKVSMNLGGQQVSWQGQLVRSLGTIDSQTRMATVVVQVDDPYGLKSLKTFPLVNGAFVNIEFSGITLNQVVEIPRAALHSNNTVWTVGPDNRLLIRPVTIGRKLYDMVVINSGLTTGEKVIVSALAGAADGMKLRPMDVEDNQ